MKIFLTYGDGLTDLNLNKLKNFITKIKRLLLLLSTPSVHQRTTIIKKFRKRFSEKRQIKIHG